ncbi:hypothetical protein FACS189472_16440 [Alphaproteobacteria bacterium]|nr:hypothetical protein FACS189472_16440 [Alphaproteobacteria bacterium]
MCWVMGLEAKNSAEKGEEEEDNGDDGGDDDDDDNDSDDDGDDGDEGGDDGSSSTRGGTIRWPGALGRGICDSIKTRACELSYMHNIITKKKMERPNRESDFYLQITYIFACNEFV